MKNRLNQLLNELVIDLCGHRYTHCYLHQRHNIVHPHLFGFGEFDCCFSLFLDWGGRTTTCIVITLPGTSPTGTRDSARVLLFSSILPTLMSFTSLTVFGAISLFAGPDVGAVGQPELHLDRLLHASHLHGPGHERLPPPPTSTLKFPPGNRSNRQGRGGNPHRNSGGRKGPPEIRAGRASTDADPTEDPIFCARI